MEWWERFNLIDDPFERRRGIAEEKISSLVVETGTFKKYRRRSERPETLFGKVILLHGEYGSGKTTLFQYLRNHFRDTNIWCRIIRLGGSFKESKEIEKEFNMNIYFELNKRKKEPTDRIDVLNSFITHKDSNELKGYMIFIDELHKNQHYEASLEFLKNLQGSLEEIFEHVNLGVIIAGHAHWKKRIEENPVYSGTFDNQDEMQDITVEEAEQILSARLREYSTDKTPHEIITQEAVHKIYAQLSEKTPRELFKKVQSVLNNLPETVTKATPTEIEREIEPNKLRFIQERLMKAGGIHRKFLKITKHYPPEESKKILRIISKVYETPIPFDGSKLDRESMINLDIKDSSIIVDLMTFGILESKTNHVRERGMLGGTIQYAKKTARLDKDIQALLADIDRHYGVSPEDYLLRVYTSEKGIEKEPKVTKDLEEVINMRVIREYLSQTKLKKAVQHIDRTIEDYSDIWKFERGAHILKPQDVPNKCENSMYHLLSAYQIYKENNDDVNTEADTIFDAAINDAGNEDLSELYPAVKAIKNEAKSIDRDEAGPIVDLYFSAIKDTVAMFFEDVKYDQMLDFHSENLTTEDKERFREIRNILIKESAPEVAKTKAQDYFEPKMREFIAKVLENKYGDNWYEDRVPKKIQFKISTAIKRKREKNPDFKVSTNKLHHSTFSLLLGIITDKSNWHYCFKDIFGGTDRNLADLEAKWNEINSVRGDWAHINSLSSPDHAVLRALMDMIEILKWTKHRR